MKETHAKLPLMTFDLDGVICRPPLGWNIGISRDLTVPDLPERIERRSPDGQARLGHAVASLMHTLRYVGRRPLPEAREALIAISAFRTPVLVTARNSVVLPFVDAWLRRHDLRDCFFTLYANDTALRSAQFKLHQVRRLGAKEHVDDDGATAYFLGRHGFPRVYLRDWPRNRGLPYPISVRVVHSLLDVVEDLAKGE